MNYPHIVCRLLSLHDPFLEFLTHFEKCALSWFYSYNFPGLGVAAVAGIVFTVFEATEPANLNPVARESLNN